MSKQNIETIAIGPRNQCLAYMQAHNVNPEELDKEEFDDLVRKKLFQEGPFRDTFGDNTGEPYNPDRQAFGQLKNGRYVYCELNESKQQDTK